MDRNPTARSGRHPLADLFVSLEGGDSLLIFPEGTRVEQGKEENFKPGIYHLARKFPEVPLIPVDLENLGRILPKGEFLPLPLVARVSLRQPITLEGGETKQQFLARAQQTLT